MKKGLSLFEIAIYFDITIQTVKDNLLLYGLKNEEELYPRQRCSAEELQERRIPIKFAHRKIECPIVTDMRTGKQYRDVTALYIE